MDCARAPTQAGGSLRLVAEIHRLMNRQRTETHVSGLDVSRHGIFTQHRLLGLGAVQPRIPQKIFNRLPTHLQGPNRSLLLPDTTPPDMSLVMPNTRNQDELDAVVSWRSAGYYPRYCGDFGVYLKTINLNKLSPPTERIVVRTKAFAMMENIDGQERRVQLHGPWFEEYWVPQRVFVT